jgi:multicomponent Na+:H+ antiporter subunit D
VTWLPVLPVAIPLVVAFLMALTTKPGSEHRAKGFLGGAVHAVASTCLLAAVAGNGPIETRMGSFPRPFAISFEATAVSAGLLALMSWVVLAALVVATATVDRPRLRRGFHPTSQVVLAAASGALLSGDLFNLFVWFELMLTSSFVLTTLGSSRAQLAAGFKYLLVSLVASAFFLCACGLAYGWYGTLDLARLAALQTESPGPGPVMIGGLALVAMAVKSALFPVYAWLPDAYSAPPPGLVGLLAAVSTKVAAFALLRIGSALFPAGGALWFDVLIWAGAATALVAALAAVSENDLRRRLAFLLVSQMGTVGLAVGIRSSDAVVLLIAHEMVAMAGLFFATAALARSVTAPWAKLAVRGGFLVCALAVAGVPPTSGFVAKLAFVQAGLQTDRPWAVAAVLLASVFSLYALLQAWFVTMTGDGAPGRSVGWPVSAVCATMAVMTVVGGLAAGPLVAGAVAQGRMEAGP